MADPPDPPRVSPPPPPSPPQQRPSGPGVRNGSASNDRVLSVLTHGGIVVCGFVIPLVLYAAAGGPERPETKWHSREALNFQLTFVLGCVLTYVLTAVVSLVLNLPTFDSGTPSPAVATADDVIFGVYVIVIGLLIVLNIVFSVFGAIAAGRGVRWKYPIRIPFIRS